MTFGNKFSPRVWGWSDLMAGRYDNAIVFPTRVGMVRSFAGGRPACASFPHACGDGPQFEGTDNSGQQFSPRVWGWSAYKASLHLHGYVFPTRVGMVRV